MWNIIPLFISIKLICHGSAGLPYFNQILYFFFCFIKIIFVIRLLINIV